MPQRCVFCGVESTDTEVISCTGCAEDLPWNDCCCPRCAQPLAVCLPAGVTCGDCQARPPAFRAAVAPLIYTFPTDAAIKALKFRRRLEYVPVFTRLLDAVLPRLEQDIDALLPVPLHWRRHAVRGFNQAMEIGKPLARQLRLPILSSAYRIRHTPYQSGLTAGERRSNLAAAFRVHAEIEAQHVLIIDDVITTGETCEQLARALLRAGARKVSVAAVARAAKPD